MIDPEKYHDSIDESRIRRVSELSAIKRTMARPDGRDPERIRAKATVMLCYAVWEGFFRDCVSTYWEFLGEKGGRIRDTDWMLLVGAISSDLDALRSRNHTPTARRDFVKKLQTRLESRFSKDIGSDFIKLSSNLNYAHVQYSYGLLKFDLSKLVEFQNRLDRELVGWRNAVAHGDPPDLSSIDISDHIDFTSTLLIHVSDSFQEAILARS